MHLSFLQAVSGADIVAVITLRSRIENPVRPYVVNFVGEVCKAEQNFGGFLGVGCPTLLRLVPLSSFIVPCFRTDRHDSHTSRRPSGRKLASPRRGELLSDGAN
jgi:hypothetical protein